MNLLLDTHTLIWALEDNQKMPDYVKEMIVDTRNSIFVSSASIWEIAIKKSVKQDFAYDPETIINICSRIGFRFLGIGVSELKVYNSLKVKDGEKVNNDPFDKILISQAKVNEMKLLTHDSLIKKYNEECVLGF